LPYQIQATGGEGGGDRDGGYKNDGRVEYKRLGGLEEISYEHNARSCTSNGGWGRLSCRLVTWTPITMTVTLVAVSNTSNRGRGGGVNRDGGDKNDGRVEYKRLGGLEAISYGNDARCIKYKRGLEVMLVMSWDVAVSNTSNGGRSRRKETSTS
jgi:hypothetical protein